VERFKAENSELPYFTSLLTPTEFKYAKPYVDKYTSLAPPKKAQESAAKEAEAEAEAAEVAVRAKRAKAAKPATRATPATPANPSTGAKTRPRPRPKPVNPAKTSTPAQTAKAAEVCISSIPFDIEMTFQ